MARYNLFKSIKRSVSSILNLAVKAARRNAPAPSNAPAGKTKRPKTPDVTPPPPVPSPISEYEKIIEELKRQNEEQARRIEELEAKLKQPVNEPILETPEFTEDDLPYEIKDDIPSQEIEFSEDDLPYEVIDEPEKEPIDNTYKNFGSDDSLEVLIDFLSDNNLSGVSPDSPFFDMDPLHQKMMLLDYVDFQHDANPSLFYKGCKALSLENVPIWGSEFERFVNTTLNFDGMTSEGSGSIDISWMDDLLTNI